MTKGKFIWLVCGAGKIVDEIVYGRTRFHWKCDRGFVQFLRARAGSINSGEVVHGDRPILPGCNPLVCSSGLGGSSLVGAGRGVMEAEGLGISPPRYKDTKGES